MGLSPVCRIWTLGALINEDVLTVHFCRCVSVFGKLPVELHQSHVWAGETVCFVSVAAAAKCSSMFFGLCGKRQAPH